MTAENVTVLFTDLVDSTRLQSSVTPDLADELRREHFSILRTAIGETGGREVKNLGDGLMVAFSSASAGIACAVAMQQAIELNGRAKLREMGLRVGLASGEVTREDEDYFGDPVIEAARLCARCEGGQILATELVRLTAGRRSPHQYQSLGGLDLKGLPDPVQAIEILWEPLEEHADDDLDAPLPPVFQEEGRFPFAGRERETAQLLETWESVAAETTRLVLISGEPGIGKTRLTAELAAQVASDGGIVLAGRCDELVGIPYQPFVEALRFQLTTTVGTRDLGSSPAELARLVPELANVIPSLAAPIDATPEAERIALFVAVRSWLAALAEERSVLLVVDDLHWADKGSLLLMRHVVANDPVAGLLVVGTYRDTDLDRTHPLSSMLADLHRRGDVERISLRGLDEQGVTELMVKTAGHELDEAGSALAVSLQQDTGGNPFFVGEVLRHLVEQGSIAQEDGRWVSAGGEDQDLPEGIRQVVGRRISVLPEETQKALSTASVIGARFDLDLLSSVTETRGDELLDSLDPALDAHLVLETGVGRYQFAHALVRSTLHAELSTTRRSRLHRAVAEALEKLHGADLDVVMADLAYHWGETADSAFADAAFSCARRAAELAMDRAAPDEAARWYQIARERLDGGDPALDALLQCKQGTAEAYAGVDGWNRTLLDAARAAERLGDAETLVDALSINMRVNFTLFADEPDFERIELITRTMPLVADDPVLAARLSFALGEELTFTNQFERKREVYWQTRDFLHRIDDPVAKIRIQIDVAGSIPFSVLTADRERELQEELLGDLKVCEALGDPELEFYTASALSWGELFLGSGDEAVWVERSTELRRHLLNPLARHDDIGPENLILLKGGLFDQAVARLSEYASRSHALGVPGTEALATVAMLQQIRESDGVGGLVDLLAESPAAERERVESIPGPYSGLLAWSLADGGRHDEARALIQESSAKHFTDIPDDAGLPVSRVAWAEAAAIAGDRKACESLVELLAPYHDMIQLTGAWYAGSTSRYLAILSVALGDFDVAERWFMEADAHHLRAGTPPWLARGRVDWGELKLAQGDRSRAVELGHAALEAVGDLDLASTRGRAMTLIGAPLSAD